MRQDIQAEAQGQPTRGDDAAVAVSGYPKTARERPLAPASVRIAQEVAAKFRMRHLNEVTMRGSAAWLPAALQLVTAL